MFPHNLKIFILADRHLIKLYCPFVVFKTGNYILSVGDKSCNRIDKNWTKELCTIVIKQDFRVFYQFICGVCAILFL